MSQCKCVDNPLNSNEKLHSLDSSGDADPVRYRNIVGGLLYLTHTRPDIMHAESLVSRFMQKPSLHHLGAVKRILLYINGTVSHGI